MVPSAMDYLRDDHRRLERLMAVCGDSMHRGEVHEAARRFEEYRRGLMRHIKIEEGIVFPAYEEATGLPRLGGPTGVMHQEHEEILRLLGLLHEIFESAQPSVDEFDSLRSNLIHRLTDHNGKEERVLYPGVDREVAAHRLPALVRAMREFPE